VLVCVPTAVISSEILFPLKASPMERKAMTTDSKQAETVVPGSRHSKEHHNVYDLRVMIFRDLLTCTLIYMHLRFDVNTLLQYFIPKQQTSRHGIPKDSSIRKLKLSTKTVQTCLSELDAMKFPACFTTAFVVPQTFWGIYRSPVYGAARL